MGRINHTISVEPIAINGIMVYDDQMCVAQSISQISCVVGLKRDAKVQSKSSLPLRLPNILPRNASMEGCSTRWCNDEIGSTEKGLTFDYKLNGKTSKTFEFSIRLKRGNEEMEIGISSLSFLGVVLGAELDIPIYKTFSKEAKVISQHNPDKKGGLFSRSKKGSNDYIMDEIRSQLHSHSHPLNQVKRFRGGDGGRSYALQTGARIRVKVQCVPSCGNVEFTTFQKMIEMEKERAQSNVLKSIGRFSNGQSTDSSQTQMRPLPLLYGSDSMTLSTEQIHPQMTDRYSPRLRNIPETNSDPQGFFNYEMAPIRNDHMTLSRSSADKVSARHCRSLNATQSKEIHRRHSDDNRLRFRRDLVETTNETSSLNSYHGEIMIDENRLRNRQLRIRKSNITDDTSSPFKGINADCDESSISMSTLTAYHKDFESDDKLEIKKMPMDMTSPSSGHGACKNSHPKAKGNLFPMCKHPTSNGSTYSVDSEESYDLDHIESQSYDENDDSQMSLTWDSALTSKYTKNDDHIGTRVRDLVQGKLLCNKLYA